MCDHPYDHYRIHNSVHSTCKTKWGYYWNPPIYNPHQHYCPHHQPMTTIPLHDYGQQPFVVNIDHAAKQNTNYRTALWTGKHFQVTLMSIGVGEDIGLEVHPTTDQFIRIEQGQALVQMGDHKDHLDFQVMAYDDFAVMIPSGKWHNVINTGHVPLKVFVIYAPPEHPFGTVHQTNVSGGRG